MNSKGNFYLVSLGCFRNNYDSGLAAERLKREGYSFKGSGVSGKNSSLEILAINTCGFIEKAKEESLEYIRKALELKKKGRVKKIYVFGCLVQRYRKDLETAFPKVDKWWGVEDFGEFKERFNLFQAHSDFLKICEGCRHLCSYCAIPLIKGKLKSKSIPDILQEARSLDESGIKELNLIGQDITSWGKDLGRNDGLRQLLELILKTIKNIKWVRLIYTHPRHISDSLIDLIAKDERICKYVDLPIQHASDRILKKMNRNTSKSRLRRLIARLRSGIPECVIRSSVITGFPTETEEDFQELLEFLDEVKFERLGVFTYSREEGTKAYDFKPQVHPSTKKRRYRRIMEQQQRISARSLRRFVGKEIDVLIEERNRDIFIGRSQYDAPEVDGVVFVKRKGLSPGNFCRVKIIDSYDYDLLGV